MLGASSAPAGRGAVNLAFDARTTQEEEGPAHGGSDDPADNEPITLESLTRSWNPGIKKFEDRPAFLEFMPDDELPDPDDEFLSSLPVPSAPNNDPIALLQPSVAVLARSLGGWTRTLCSFVQPTLLSHRAWRHLIRRPPSALQDPEGRVLIARTRIANLGLLLLLDGPLSEHDTQADIRLIRLCLELSAREREVEATRIAVQESEVRLPRAGDVARETLQTHASQLQNRQPDERGNLFLRPTLEDLCDFVPPSALLPDLSEQAPETEDDLDPLGLDQILKELTGAPPDPQAPLYRAAMVAAEAIACEVTRARVQVAGVAMTLTAVLSQMAHPVPGTSLLRALEAIDQEGDKLLQLLVEIAQAARQRMVPPNGLQNGLKRAVRQLDRTNLLGLTMLHQVALSYLEGMHSFFPVKASPEDPLANAHQDGRPQDAVSWLESLPASVDRDLAIAFTKLSAGTPDLDEMKALLPRLQGPRHDALRLCITAVAVQKNAPEVPHLAHATLARGQMTQNGLLMAEGCFLLLDQGLLLPAQRRHIAVVAHSFGAQTAANMIARWIPPQPDVDA